MFTLKNLFSTSNPVETDDLMITKKALNKLGYYDIPSHRGLDDWTDDATFDGLKRFQRDHNLKVDGLMRPGGPTEAALNRNLMRVSFTGDQKAGSGGEKGGKEQPQLHAMPWSKAVPGRTHSTHPIPDPNLEWDYVGQLSRGKKLEKVPTCGPLRVDEVSQTFGIDGKLFSIDWHDRTADGQTIIPMDRKADNPNRAVLGGHQLPGTRTRYYEAPFPRMEGGNYTAEVDFPPDKDYNANSAGPYLRVYVPKKCKGMK